MAYQSYFGMGLEAAQQGLQFEDFAPSHPTHRKWYRAGFNDWPRVANMIETERARREEEEKAQKKITRAAGKQ